VVWGVGGGSGSGRGKILNLRQKKRRCFIRTTKGGYIHRVTLPWTNALCTKSTLSGLGIKSCRRLRPQSQKVGGESLIPIQRKGEKPVRCVEWDLTNAAVTGEVRGKPPHPDPGLHDIVEGGVHFRGLHL